MAKCGDCLYFGFCKKYIDPEETFPEIGGCHTFESKDDFVEVVRCKDCKHFIQEEHGCDHFGYYSHTPWVDEAGFCSHGERREGE